MDSAALRPVGQGRYSELTRPEGWSEGSPRARLPKADQHGQPNRELHESDGRLEDQIPSWPGRGQESRELKG
jgi:hypothetical protein